MALSLGNHRRAQTSSTAWAAQHQRHSSSSATSQIVRKQHSFIESGISGGTPNTGGRGCLTRGLSVGRTFDNYRQKLILPVGGGGAGVGRPKYSTSIHLQKTASTDHDHINKHRANTKSKELALKIAAKHSSHATGGGSISGFSSTSNISDRVGVGSGSGIGGSCTRGAAETALRVGRRSSRIVAWSSTSSLLRSLDEELSQVIGVLDSRKNNSSNPSINLFDSRHKTKQPQQQFSNDQLIVNENQPQMTNRQHPSKYLLSTTKNEINKVNLNIVLSQTIKATAESEAVFSDADSSSECTDIVSSFSSQTAKHLGSPTNKILEHSISSGESVATTCFSAPYRRDQFQSGRQTTTNTTSPTTITISPTSAAIAVTPQNTGIFSASPSLTIQRRPPLVRAMSAPVRSLDENSKSVFAASKRKSRRRKHLSRDISCDKIEAITNFGVENKTKDLLLDSNKKVLSRARSVVAPDVVTLVSLISSEGSDSEKDDLSSATTATNSDNSPKRRAPSLRKTGKSVSFQENYPPNFQLAAKEYSHMIRRGSIAPLAARIRANRPPTAPPVSIYLSDLNNSNAGMTSPHNSEPTSSSISLRSAEGEKTMSAETEKEKSSTNSIVVSPPEYVFPDYVRSIKERECWKLYQKMSKKGVIVTYDVILRGMLTPTEFRQLQRQREFEEAKVRETEEAAAAAAAINLEEKVKTPTSAIERLSETLLKK